MSKDRVLVFSRFQGRRLWKPLAFKHLAAVLLRCLKTAGSTRMVLGKWASLLQLNSYGGGSPVELVLSI